MEIDELAAFCKRKGFIYHNSEIYGGFAGFFDYGPLGVELKNNIKSEWWTAHVWARPDIVGIDGAIIAHPSVWKASGHVDQFADIMLICASCKERFKATTLLEELAGISVEGWRAEQINEAVVARKLRCPKCKGTFELAQNFNLMFATQVGPLLGEEARAYLRPETAQLIFANFNLVVKHARLKLPFGIAQIGKAFRNEISPRGFLFRCREFEQMELEYFVDPRKKKECPYIDQLKDYAMLVYSAEAQESGREQELMTVGSALEAGIIANPWHAYWLAFEHRWFVSLGANPQNLRVRQHLAQERSHYATDTWDLEYAFPFGWKELQGIADRGDFDLKQHSAHSGTELAIYDESSKTKIVPHVVAEPSQGVERAFLVFLLDAYRYDKERKNVVLALHPRLAPIKVAIFPLLSNRPELVALARKTHAQLRPYFNSVLDLAGSIGRRYARQDESGTPWCVTIDFDSLRHNDCTLRDRDSMAQKRIEIAKLVPTIRSLIDGSTTFDKL